MKNPTDIWNAKTSDYNNLSRTKSETSRSFFWTKHPRKRKFQKEISTETQKQDENKKTKIKAGGMKKLLLLQLSLQAELFSF